MINFKPVTDRVAIRLEPKEDKTKGGIIVTDVLPQPRCIGVVEGIGPLAIGCCFIVLTSCRLMIRRW